jgi:hypothetical protein
MADRTNTTSRRELLPDGRIAISIQSAIDIVDALARAGRDDHGLLHPLNEALTSPDVRLITT